ncbi:WGR domain-containing protein [bacterium]|nr:WGR domain-containing protein [bacterium]
MKTHAQSSLYYKKDTSDKEYHAQVVKEGKGYVVNFQYGRRGGNLQTGTKTVEAVTLEEAVKVFSKLVKSKENKGYKENKSSANKATKFEVVTSNEDRETGLYPQLLNEVLEKDVMDYINDDNYVAQEKKDGECRMLKKTTDSLGINKKGLSVPLPTKVASSMKVPGTVHGEIIGNKLFVWDLRSLNGKSIENKPYLKRLELLEGLEFGKNIEVVDTAVGKEAKLKLYKKLKKNKAEGLVFKIKNHKYQEGRPNSGGDVFKCKFYATATVRVADHTKGKRSVGLEMLEGKSVIRVGKVTVSSKHDIPPVGSYIEVKYLYAYKGGSLYQPSYKGLRPDQDDSDIKLKQLKYKAE